MIFVGIQLNKTIVVPYPLHPTMLGSPGEFGEYDPGVWNRDEQGPTALAYLDTFLAGTTAAGKIELTQDNDKWAYVYSFM